MRTRSFLLGCCFIICLSGCGSKETPLVTTPLTPEQQKQVTDEDRRIDEEESPNNKTRQSKTKRY